MRCARCQGLMIQVLLEDHCNTIHEWVNGVKCLNCGSVLLPPVRQQRHRYERLKDNPLPKVVA